jgi:hypothetical protein
VNRRIRTISNAPRITPQRTLLNQRPPSKTSSGSSTNSANGFSSNVSVNDDAESACGAEPALVGFDAGELWVTTGTMFKNDLNPTCTMVEDDR